jgi:DNA-binding NarL/FixJ family response regulator
MARCGGSCNGQGHVPLRCLIVDDNASFREEMRGLLTEQGVYVVGAAGSAAEAIRQMAELRPDVALIDIDLCGESGFDLARRLRDQPGQASVPDLILISTHEESEYADLIEASSAIGFLSKIDLSAATIRRTLSRSDGHQER